MTKHSKKQKKQLVTPKREVDAQFESFDRQFQHPFNRTIQNFCIPIFSFAVLGLVWVLPFPEIAFLEKYGYDTFINWGSFFIAAMVYYYLRLAPTLSYAMLLTVGVFSFLIVQLEYIEQGGGPEIWLVCSTLLSFSFVILYIAKDMERRPVSLREFFRLLLLGPIWLWHFVFKKLNIPY
ncbi:hypothetical protein [Parapedobacter tibetensis]|uniref:hypothetical protein n=1 Tax=Parapedobacter tibetensis TaxID=2972951 RepID=UPI00214DD8F7|nr:hypothetical protein [Parapedobacter tibetensis]